MRVLFRCLVIAASIAPSVEAENLLWVESGSALPGAPDVALGLYAKHDEPMHAFSAAIRYEKDAFSFSRIDLDGAGAVTGQVGYEYSQAKDDPEAGILIIAVLLDYQSPYDFHEIPASPDEGQLLGTLVFAVAGRAEPGQYQFQPRNRIGSPPIENVFSVRGRTVNPDLESGVFTVINPHQAYVLDTDATAGGLAVVTVQADHRERIGGYQIVLRYPSDLLSIDVTHLGDAEPDVCKWPVTFCGLGLETILGTNGVGKQPIENFSAFVDPNYSYGATIPGTGAGRVWAAALFDFQSPYRDQTLPPGSQAILSITFNVSNAVTLGQEIPVTLVNGTGDPVFSTIYVVPIPDEPDVSVSPDLHAGTIRIADGFKRGLINATDSRVDLADVIFMLGYLFTRGAAPSCLKAADVNDDGALDVGDAIKLLGHLFGNQGPLPLPNARCGGDPTPDNLSCIRPIGC